MGNREAEARKQGKAACSVCSVRNNDGGGRRGSGEREGQEGKEAHSRSMSRWADRKGSRRRRPRARDGAFGLADKKKRACRISARCCCSLLQPFPFPFPFAFCLFPFGFPLLSLSSEIQLHISTRAQHKHHADVCYSRAWLVSVFPPRRDWQPEASERKSQHQARALLRGPQHAARHAASRSQEPK